jgi:hypothetical protein
MATSPNYSWPEPDNTDLVKNGALAIRTMGNAIDTTMATMTPKSTYTAKGSIAAATGASTPANLSVGNNGETLVADSSTSTGLRYQSNFAAGKNKIINGDFGIWQRGTSFSTPNSAYTADRYQFAYGGSPTFTITQQTLTPGSITGYDAPYCLQHACTVSGGSITDMYNKIENVQNFAGQTATVSFWAKAISGTPVLTALLTQNFGSGGSASVDTTSSSFTLTSSWVRYSATIAVPSITGKTIGAGSYLLTNLRFTQSVATFQLWGLQFETGSVATAFQTASGSLGGELALCQRYYEKSYAQATAPGTATFTGCYDFYINQTVTGAGDKIQYKVTKRTAPTVTIYSPSTGTSGKLFNNANATDYTATQSSVGENTFSFYWTQASTGLNVSYHYVASAEL